MTRILVVGGVAGGATAAARAKRLLPQARVALFDRDIHISYAACGIPYCLARSTDCDSLVARTAEQLEQRQGLEVFLRHEVVDVDAERGRLLVRDLESGEEREEPYDRLILATGATPTIPPIPGREAAGVFALRTLTDAVELARFLGSRAPGRAAVVGAGPIGLEMCECFCGLGMQVSLVEMAPEILPAVAPQISSSLREHLIGRGIEVFTSTKVVEIASSEGAVTGLLTDGGFIPADLVLLSVGIRPQVELASKAGLELGTAGAIRVDRQMRTSREEILAAGDCCTSYHLVSGQEVWIPLGSTARKQGRVAGANAAGASEDFPGVLGTFILKCFDMAVGSTGLDEKNAAAAGFDPVEVTVEGEAVPAYYADRGTLHIRLVADASTGRILGAQVAGDVEANVDKRLDVLATAVAAGISVTDLETLDLAYAPPFSTAVDLPLVAGAQASHAMARARERG